MKFIALPKLVLWVFCFAFAAPVFELPCSLLAQEKTDSESKLYSMVLQAITKGDVQTLEQLLRNGADPNATGEKGETVLHAAVRLSGDFSTGYGLVKALLAHGANPNQPNNEGMTPVFTAALHGSEAVTAALLEAGGDPYISAQGLTPFEVALMEGNDGAASAMEKVAEYTPSRTLLGRSKAELAISAAFNKAVGRILKNAESMTEDERREALITAINQLSNLSEEQRKGLVQTIIEQMELHKLPKDRQGSSCQTCP